MNEEPVPGLAEIARQVQGVLVDFKSLSTRLQSEFVSKEILDLTLANVALRQVSLENENKELSERVSSLEDDKKWLFRLVIGSIVLGLLGVLFYLGQAPGTG